MHMHIACSNEWQTELLAERCEPRAALGIIGIEQSLSGDPQRARKTRHEPACFLGIGDLPR